MASKKLQKYCSIDRWIETRDPKFANAINRDLCMGRTLSAGRRSGVTLLFPPEKVRKEIIKLTHSETMEEAIRLMEAHIVPVAIHAASDFKSDVGSRLGVKFEVEKIDNGAVVLKGGAKLAPAKDFAPLKRDNISVWEVVDGTVPLEGPEYALPYRKRGESKGAAEPEPVRGGDSHLNSRQVLATNVESEFDRCMRADRCRSKDPYISYSVSLLNFLKTHHPSIFAAVSPVVDRDPAVTFYILVEPYKTRGEFLLPEHVLFGPTGWNGAAIYENGVSEFAAFFEALPHHSAASAEDRSSGEPVVPFIYRDVGFLRSAVDNIRLGIIGEDGRRANRVSTPKQVRQVYETLITQNSVGGAQPILPDATVRILPGAKKLWQDELRFVLHSALEQIRRMPVYEAHDFGEVVRMLRFNRPGNDYGRESTLSSASELGASVAPTQEFSLLLKFINSTEFLYFPVPREKVGGDWGEIPTTVDGGDSKDLSVLDAEVSKAGHLDRLKASGADASRTLSASTIAQIRHYYDIHGELPPGIAN